MEITFGKHLLITPRIYSLYKKNYHYFSRHITIPIVFFNFLEIFQIKLNVNTNLKKDIKNKKNLNYRI